MTFPVSTILAEIERRAREATPGVWKLFSSNVVVAVLKGRKEVVGWTGFDGSEFPRNPEANAAHIAACCPANILAVVESYRALEARVKELDTDKTALGIGGAL